MNYFIYTSHHFTARENMNSINWLIPLKPWFFQASSFQLLKLENLLRWSFFTSIVHSFRVYTASSKNKGGLENSRILLPLWVFRWGYVNTEKVLYCVHKIIFKLSSNLKRHNRVYILLSKHTYWPMGARVVGQLFSVNTKVKFPLYLRKAGLASRNIVTR